MYFNNTAKWIEIFCAHAINDYIIKDENFVVGDCANEHLPDIYSLSHSVGIEIVQLEKDCDLDIKYIWKAYEEYNGDFEKIKDFCDATYKGLYELTEYNAKLGSFTTNEGSHSIDWMKEIYKKNIIKKLRKLNSGNYSGITGEMLLCASIVQRAKSLYDVLLILYTYLRCAKDFDIKYNKIVVVTSTKLYLLSPENVNYISPIIYHEQICDFKLDGDDYLKIYDYDYDKCHKITSINFLNV